MANTSQIRNALSMMILGSHKPPRNSATMPTCTEQTMEAEEPSAEEKERTKEMDHMTASVQEAARNWLADDGIQGIGIGRRVKGDETQNELALKVYVEKKVARRKRSCPLAPKHVRINGRENLRIDGTVIPLDVEEIGRLQLESKTPVPDRKALQTRPVEAGCSIFYEGITDAGTLGCLVKKTKHPWGYYILSNSHVIANKSTGDSGHAVVQPGLLDASGGKSNAIAHLSEWVEFQFADSELLNTCDAAIAKIVDGEVSSVISGLGKPPRGDNRIPRIGMKVRKSGRSSSIDREGVVKDVDFMTPTLSYKKPGGGEAPIRFHRQVLCTTFTDPGDSGAAVLDKNDRVVGLHFAGSESVSVFNRIGFVLNTFDLKIVTRKIPRG